jgi:DNA-binding response OmpR family regulator
LTANILIIEDDYEIHDLLVVCLQSEGYTTHSCFDGEAAMMQLQQHDVHLVILDLMIPQIDGYEVLRRLRETKHIPVLILSAKGQETDKMLGLTLGADDYLSKPFGLGELTARVRALLRRYLYFNPQLNGKETNMISYGDLVVDLDTFQVSIGQKKIDLRLKEFELLKLFLSYPTKVFTKTQIYQSIWKDEYLSDENTVTVHIRRLRVKIEPDPSNPTYIQTVWGIGYKLGELI